MTRVEFMKELAYLLQDLSNDERTEALQFYNNYFYDAGPENEQQIIEELGSPERIAAIVRGDTVYDAEADEVFGEYTESGYKDKRYREPRYEVENRRREPEKEESVYEEAKTYEAPNYETREPHAKPKRNGWKFAFWVVIAIILSPVWIGLLVGFFGILAGAVIVVAALIFSAFAVVGSCVIGGIVLLVMGLVHCVTTNPLSGLLIIGIALLSIGLGIWAMAALVWLIRTLLPWLFRGIAGLTGRIFKKRGGKNEKVQ